MKKISLNHNWKFHYQKKTASRLLSLDISAWRDLDLPHDWSIELERHPDNLSGDSGGYFPMGMGWYQKNLSLDESWRDKKVFIEFEGVYMNATVWLNRHCLGRHPYGYTSFHYDLTPYLDWGSENTLKVFVDNSHQLNSRWYSGSGIYRPVWLKVAEPVHVAQWGVFVTTPEVSTAAALVNIKTQVENEIDSDQIVTVRTRVSAPDGTENGGTEIEAIIAANGNQEINSEFPIPYPQLWSPDSPALYQAETAIIVDGTIIDTETTTFGIRKIEFSAEKGFLLNEEPVLLKGGCVHHDNGILGAASYPRAEERKVEIHKTNGYNAIRCAHNPPAPAFLEACDRLGMLVIDEAFDCWQEGKNHGDYHVTFDDWWQRDLDAMLYRDRNHPSIIMWSIGNEVVERDGYGEGYEISRMLAEYVRQVDPTRPVTAAICDSWRGDPWEIMDPSFATLDVGGYNYQWAQNRPDNERLPNRIMMGTESFALEAFENWQAVEEIPALIGDFVWTSLDYLGEAGIGRAHFEDEKFPFLGGYPWHQANCGDLDLCGFKRPQSYYRDILWDHGDSLYIAVHSPVPEGQTPNVTLWGWPEVWPNWNWPGRAGQNFKVEVYSACDEVELFINGQSLGKKSTTKAEKHRASFEVAYELGALKAVGYLDGKPTAEKELKTVGTPAAIRLTPDRTPILAQPDDLCYVTVEVIDENGNVHPNADDNISFTASGTGEIAAVGSANPVSTEMYRGNQRRVFRGRCLVVLKSNGTAGKMHLSAQADGLDSAKLTVLVQ
jgi:beta-galactosidase